MRDVGVEQLREILVRVAPEVVFANTDETRLFGEPLDGPLWIEKRGADGCAFGDDARAALPVDRVVDTTGAGDALAAGWLVGGPGLALEAAARCVQRAGAMP
jgi:sugar/nucleoside kinase (ribokinase family)